VDIDADGYNDILVGSFEGVPYLIRGSEEGFSEPQQIKDATEETVVIADFWNHEEDKWDKTDRAESKGHCTSVEAVDWDDDGDLDLLLGDYYGGRLFLRLNEGSAEEPGFAKTNQAIEADGEPIVIKGGLAAPRVVDWDGDGLFDIVCGGAKGGVYFFRNTGEKDEPEFAAAESLIEPVKDPTKSFIRRVPSIDGQPALPGSSYHIEFVDFDADGDLDLLVGGRSSWLTGPIRTLTEEEEKELEEINAQIKETLKEIRELTKEVESKEDRKELVESEDYQETMKHYRDLAKEKAKYKTDPTASGDFVWLFRRK